MSAAELHVYFIEIATLIIVILLCGVGFFHAKYKHMMLFFLSLGLICGVLLKAILP